MNHGNPLFFPSNLPVGISAGIRLQIQLSIQMECRRESVAFYRRVQDHAHRRESARNHRPIGAGLSMGIRMERRRPLGAGLSVNPAINKPRESAFSPIVKPSKKAGIRSESCRKTPKSERASKNTGKTLGFFDRSPDHRQKRAGTRHFCPKTGKNGLFCSKHCRILRNGYPAVSNCLEKHGENARCFSEDALLCAKKSGIRSEKGKNTPKTGKNGQKHGKNGVFCAILCKDCIRRNNSSTSLSGGNAEAFFTTKKRESDSAFRQAYRRESAWKCAEA